MELMKDPCIAVDGHSYERKAIEEWFRTKNTSPITNLPMASNELIENHSLRSAIEQHVISQLAEKKEDAKISSTRGARTSSSSSTSS
jgi:hypothetical protein